MNTTPKQQDDGGIAAAEGSRPTLEQTVLGVAPPSSSSATQATVSGGASPPALPSAALPSPALPVTVERPIIEVSIERSNASPAAIVATPMIAVAAPPRPAEAPGSNGARGAMRAGAPAPAVVDTLPLAWPSPARPLQPEAAVERPSAAVHTGDGAPALDHTALSEDYLRAAREAALHAVAAASNAPSACAIEVPSDAPTIAQPQEELPPAELDAAPASSGTRPSVGAAAVPAGLDRPPATRGFEPVPVVRAPLADSLSGALSPIIEVGGHRHLPPPLRPPPPAPAREGPGRWILLGSVALASVGIVTLGTRLVNRYRNPTSQVAAAGELPGANLEAPAPSTSTPASRALLANRPAPERGSTDGRPTVIWATGAPSAKAEGERAAGTSQESQLAATAGRHVLSGNYAEALPLYRQLERSWPENTAYAAMARLLEKRLDTTNDTRTISPTTSRP